MNDAIRPLPLIERYRETLRDYPESTAFIWVDKHANQTLHMTYRELDEAARALAQKLGSEGVRKGDTVLLAYGPGFDFFIAFWGCLISGIVAAPVTPPISSKDVGKFIKLYRHCDGRMILTDKRFARLLKAKAYKEKISQVGRGVRSLLSGTKTDSSTTPYSMLLEERWLTTSGLPVPSQLAEFEPQPADATAFIMYSSGSTRAPKGALTTFGNLNHQLEMNGQALENRRDHVSCWWAPHYHDYGLISGFLNVINQGCKGVLASPFDFIQRPPLWLDMLHKYKGTHTFGPDFGYELLIRKTRQSERLGRKWDLRPLKVAMSAAEKVRAATLDAFSSAFEPCGFRRDVFCPAYGLAEHTVGVTINGIGFDPVIQRFLRKKLEEEGIAQAVEDTDEFDEHDERVIELVGNGIARHNTDLQIVRINADGDALEVMPPGRVGEVWVSSESKTIGYFKEPELTEHAFHARLPDGSKPSNHYLRTGDLGFISLESGELFICGRQKDMIILAGKNHYSEDLEVTLSNHTRQYLRPGRIAAFSFEEAGTSTERLGIVAEVRNDDIDRTTVFNVIKTCLASEHKINVSTIALIKSGSIPKTSSGKLRRFEARERLLDNTLDIINHGIWTAPVSDFDSAPSYEETLAMLINTIEGLQSDNRRIDATSHLPSLKLTSLAVAQLVEAIRAEHPHVEFQESALSSFKTPKALAEFLVQGDDTGRTNASQPMPELTRHPSTAPGIISTVLHPLLYTQERTLSVTEHPYAEYHHETVSGWISGTVSNKALSQALEWLAQRHSALRTTFQQSKDGSYGQLIQTDWDIRYFEHLDVHDEEEALQSAVTFSRAPFNVSQCVFKVALIRVPEGRHLLVMVMHPVISDRWTTQLVQRDLFELYNRACDGGTSPPSLEPIAFEMVDIAHWQQGLLQNHAFDRRISFWKTYLRAPLPHLKIPAERYPGTTTESISTSIRVEPEIVRGIRNACKRWETTPQVIYLTAYAAVLSRRYRQYEVVIEMPGVARTPETQHLAGCITESAWVRVSIPRRTSFERLVVQNQDSYDEALKHEVPLGLLYEVLEQPDAELDTLSSAVLTIGHMRDPKEEPAVDFGSAIIKPTHLNSRGVTSLPTHTHSALNLWVTSNGELHGVWSCKQSLMNQADLDALKLSFERILAAVSGSLKEGPSLEDTVELKAAANDPGISSTRIFSKDPPPKSTGMDLSRPALQGDGARAEDQMKRPKVPARGSQDLFAVRGTKK